MAPVKISAYILQALNTYNRLKSRFLSFLNCMFTKKFQLQQLFTDPIVKNTAKSKIKFCYSESGLNRTNCF